jgi:hypothetical protein
LDLAVFKLFEKRAIRAIGGNLGELGDEGRERGRGEGKPKN